MRYTFFLIAMVVVPPSSVRAEVYKCNGETGTTIYQAVPCREAGDVIALDTYNPSAADRRTVLEQSQKARSVVQSYEDERERNRMAAERDRRRKAAADAAREARCARYANELTARRQGKGGEDERRRRVDAKYFSECLGRR